MSHNNYQEISKTYKLLNKVLIKLNKKKSAMWQSNLDEIKKKLS